MKDQNGLSQSLNARVNWIRPATRVGDKPGNQSLSRNFYALFFGFSKNIMLIYVSCETPEQITDYLCFKQVLASAWFNVFVIVVLCRT